MRGQFEADLCPTTLSPRIRFNFENGWSASLVLRTGRDRTEAMLASVAACPTGRWGQGETEILETEAFAGEAVRLLAAIEARPAIDVAAAVRGTS